MAELFSTDDGSVRDVPNDAVRRQWQVNRDAWRHRRLGRIEEEKLPKTADGRTQDDPTSEQAFALSCSHVCTADHL